ncbi:MAG: hypothetical protein Q7K57_11360 [Burkholderiaceae bacterium]|nr:hypothetical protein [Burkholderiaceae bacterium]
MVELKAKGMQYNELSPVEREKVRVAVQTVADKFAAEYDPVIVKLFRSELVRIQNIK